MRLASLFRLRPLYRTPFVRAYSPRIRIKPLINRPNLIDEQLVVPPQLSNILSEPMIIVERQLEIGSVLAGWEQGRIFILSRPDGTRLGHLEEVGMNFGTMILRQLTRLHRPFTMRLFDAYGNFLLTIRRPFMFINSQIKCITPDDALIGESQQEWHLWRRRYNLFQSRNDGTAEGLQNINISNEEDITFDQFGRIDAPWAWFEYAVQNEKGEVISVINRNWTGIGRELFTDTGVYSLCFGHDEIASNLGDPNRPISNHPLSLAQRIVMLGTMVSIDFDYYSRHSGGGGFFFFSGGGPTEFDDNNDY